jgi:transcription initiation factor TFIIF subunit alpha
VCKINFVNTCKLLAHKCQVKLVDTENQKREKPADKTRDQPQPEQKIVNDKGPSGKEKPLEKETEAEKNKEKLKNKHQLEEGKKHANKKEVESSTDKNAKGKEENTTNKDGTKTLTVETRKRQKEEPVKTKNKEKVELDLNKQRKSKEEQTKFAKQKRTSSEEECSSSSAKSSVTPVRTSSRIKVPSLKARSPQPVLFDDDDEDNVVELEDPSLGRRKSKSNK